MIFESIKIKYLEQTARITAIEKCELKIGVKKIKLKENKNGTNHDDLALAAIQWLLSYEENKSLFLDKNETFEIKPFVPYKVSGKYLINAKENIFSIS